MKQGLLLLAHGARNPAWAQPFQALAARVSAMRPDIVVSLGFLELMTPNIEEALSSLHAQGAEQVEVLPMFHNPEGDVALKVRAHCTRRTMGSRSFPHPALLLGVRASWSSSTARTTAVRSPRTP